MEEQRVAKAAPLAVTVPPRGTLLGRILAAGLASISVAALGGAPALGKKWN
jgi:hypothetical protein